MPLHMRTATDTATGSTAQPAEMPPRVLTIAQLAAMPKANAAYAAAGGLNLGDGDVRSCSPISELGKKKKKKKDKKKKSQGELRSLSPISQPGKKKKKKKKEPGAKEKKKKKRKSVGQE